MKQSKWRKKDKLNNSSKNSTPVLSNKVNNDNNKSIKNINCKLFSLNLLQIFHNILLFCTFKLELNTTCEYNDYSFSSSSIL